MKHTLILLLILIIAGGLLAYSQIREEPRKVSGFIEAHEIRVGSRVGGRVAAVHVSEGQEVPGGYIGDSESVTGELLVTLEPFDLNQRLAEAQATLRARNEEFKQVSDGFRKEEIAGAKAHYDQLQRKLEKLEAPPRQQERKIAEAQLQVAQAQAALAQKTYERIAGLHRTGAATQEDYDRAGEEVNRTRGLVIVRREELSLLDEGARKEDRAVARAQVAEAQAAWQLKSEGSRPEEIAQAKAAVEAAQAAVDLIGRQIEELKVHAPFDANATGPHTLVVEAVEIRPGDLVAAGAPVLSLMDTENLWVRAYVPENRMNLAVGEDVEVSVDSYPKERFRGKVTYINRQGEFTPSNVQTIEERSKQVFRIKVTLLDGLDRLRPGMAADVWLNEK